MTCRLNRIYFPNPRQVASAFELGREPYLHDRERLGLADRALANRKHVAVVVRSIPDRELFIPAEAATHTANSIGDDRFAVARPAQNNSALELTAGDRFGDGPNEVRIITRRIGICPEVPDRVSGLQKHGFDGFLIGEAGVIGTDGNAERVGHGRKAGVVCEVHIGRYLRAANLFPAMNRNLISTFFAMGLVALAGCSTVQSRISGHQSEYASWPPAVQQLVSRGQVAVGFTRDQVQVALGSPDYVLSRVSTEGSYEVWSYRDRGPHFSFGIGMASYGRSSAFGSGVAVGNAGYAGEKMRVIFDQTGHVSSIEQVTMR
jgi:outer membrane protein assembly factor BamE (lipoprotein component of BamABCDE complex)